MPLELTPLQARRFTALKNGNYKKYPRKYRQDPVQIQKDHLIAKMLKARTPWTHIMKLQRTSWSRIDRVCKEIATGEFC